MFKIFPNCKSRDYGSCNKIINGFSELNKVIILKSGSKYIDFKAIKI